MKFFSLSLLLALTLLPLSSVQAEPPQAGSRRGLVTTARCPYSCEIAGLDKKTCREWQAGEDCHVEDLTQAPGHRSVAFIKTKELPGPVSSNSRMRRDATGPWISVPQAGDTGKRLLQEHGLVTSASCPYACTDAGLAQAECREWSMGDVCFVEDLTQAAGHRSMLRVR